jgi:hypothetical protein
MTKNPNILRGHEGELLQVIGHFSARVVNAHNSADNFNSSVSFGGTLYDKKDPVIVMFLECGLDGSKDFYVEYIDFLHREKIYRVFHVHDKWMEIFIPWPRGGFIQRE